jgi:hypothetical protein
METDVRKHEEQGPNGARVNGTGQGHDAVQARVMATVSPTLRRRKVRVEVEIPEGLMGEFDLMMQELLVGKRCRLDTLEQEFKAIEVRGLRGLAVILTAIRSHAGSGQAGRLVHFLAGLYNGYDYPFDLSDLRPLDTNLANACLDYLNYDRLAVCDLDKHLDGGGRELQAWLRDYNIVPIDRE